jgi:hypothetical protein
LIKYVHEQLKKEEEEAAMKHAFVVMALVAAPLMYATPAVSEEQGSGLSNEYGQSTGYELFNSHKDQCLIVAINCRGGDDTVVKRVERLNREIEKGTTAYTPEELKQLQDQLNWIYYESGEFPEVRM